MATVFNAVGYADGVVSGWTASTGAANLGKQQASEADVWVPFLTGSYSGGWYTITAHTAVALARSDHIIEVECNATGEEGIVCNAAADMSTWQLLKVINITTGRFSYEGGNDYQGDITGWNGLPFTMKCDATDAAAPVFYYNGVEFTTATSAHTGNHGGVFFGSSGRMDKITLGAPSGASEFAFPRRYLVSRAD